jgi:sulfatase modifying factor 1
MGLKVLWILISIWFLSVILTSFPGDSETPGGMVLVKGGTFRMGSNEIFSDEEPVHSVTLNSFYIGKFEVTQAEWKAVIGNNPSLFKEDNYPVERVTWYDAVEFCNKKSKMEGLTPCYKGTGDHITCNFDADGFRLPTEAEWEYACQGGVKSLNYKYSGSNNANDVAWYEVNSEDKTHPVGQKKSNELGIYDLSGNIHEWCWDRYDKDYYKTSPADNPKGPGNGKNRSYRGGGACSRAIWLRSCARFNLPPETKNHEIGFRIVKNGTGKPKPPGGMVFVKGGDFKMGSSKGTRGEKLMHNVTVSSFYIGKFEVTQEEWKTVMVSNPSFRKGNSCPIHFIDWFDAVEYCNKRSRMEGLTPCYTGNGANTICNFDANGYRLPTEAEWEYACRGGLQSRHYKFSGSNDANEVAWYEKNLIVYFQPVGQKKPNELGIYDMSGNVWEWCWDWYDFDYYKNSPAKNPKGPVSGIRRIARSGSCFETEDYLWSSYRFCYHPYRKAFHIGFRVVRTAK